MSEAEHKPRVDALTDEPQTKPMQPTDGEVGSDGEQRRVDDTAGEPDGDEETHAMRQDIAETPPAG